MQSMFVGKSFGCCLLPETTLFGPKLPWISFKTNNLWKLTLLGIPTSLQNINNFLSIFLLFSRHTELFVRFAWRDFNETQQIHVVWHGCGAAADVVQGKFSDRKAFPRDKKRVERYSRSEWQILDWKNPRTVLHRNLPISVVKIFRFVSAQILLDNFFPRERKIVTNITINCNRPTSFVVVLLWWKKSPWEPKMRRAIWGVTFRWKNRTMWSFMYNLHCCRCKGSCVTTFK